MSEQGSILENNSTSKVLKLQYLNKDYRGWTTTNEDHLLLLEGLRGTKRKGGFFGVGEFQVIDVALQLGANAIVLGDLDKDAVIKNLEVLRIVESSNSVDEVLPRIFDLIEKTEGADGLQSFKEKLTNKGTHTGSRIRLSWAQSEPEYRRLKQLINDGKVAVVQVDITDPKTMSVVGKFFKSCGTSLDSAYLSNTISFDKFEDKVLSLHKGAVKALYAAGGDDNTLLIRSGNTSNPEVIRKVNETSPIKSDKNRDYEQQAHEEIAERKAHYGEIETLPELIERVYSDSLFLYVFEFFKQNLRDYKKHTQGLQTKK